MHLVLALVVSFALALGLSASVPAQDAAPGVGDAVAVIGPEGGEIGLVTVEDLVDPFEDYDPGSPPERGNHFVLLTVTIENTGSRPLEANPSSFYLQDTDGFLYAQGGVFRGSEPDPVDLQFAELDPGDEATGALGFSVLNGVEIARVLYLPASDRLIVLADLGAPAPALGETVSVIGPEGGEIAQLSVDDIQDPFADYDPGSPPERGNHLVLLTLTVEYTGSRPLPFDPSDVSLRDEDGFLYSAGSVFRDEADPPDLQFGEIAPGDQVSGAIGFSVLNDVTITEVVFVPASDQLLVLAAVGAGGPGPDVGDLIDATPEAALGTGVDGNSYTGPTYGAAVGWDEEVWSVNEDVTFAGEGYDGLRLDSDVSLLYVEAFEAFEGNAAACLEDARAELEENPGISEFAEATDREAPTADGELPENAAIYEYTFTNDAGDEGEVVYYVECRTLVEGEAVLELTYVSLPRFYDVDLPEAEAVFAALEIPGTDATPTASNDATPGPD